MADAGPIVKWVGGKTRLLPELRVRMPKTWRRYYEPFAGGAALFFDVAPSDAVLADSNGALISMYRAVAADVESVIRALAPHKLAHDQDGHYYYKMRARWNAEEDTAAHVRAALFIYLNKTGYNGLWRVNRSGKFNVPIGRYTNPSIYAEDDLRAASAALSKVQLREGGFVTTSLDAGEGDFVYFDPPYDPITKTSNFTAYTKDAFVEEHQRVLAAHAWELSQRGVRVMLSNNDTPLIRDIYAKFHIDVVKCPRSINSKGDKRGDVNEVVITSYERTA